MKEEGRVVPDPVKKESSGRGTKRSRRDRKREMVSMSGDRQRSASSSVVQEVVGSSNSIGGGGDSKESPAAATSSLTAAAIVKEKKTTTAATTSNNGNNGVMAASAPGTSNSRKGMTSSSSSSGTGPNVGPLSEQQATGQQLHNEESPNHIVYRKVRTVKHYYDDFLHQNDYTNLTNASRRFNNRSWR